MSQVEGAKRVRDDDTPRTPKHRMTDMSAPHQHEPALTPLTSVAVVCRSRPELNAISGVVQTIDSFIGADAKWTIPIVSDWNSKRDAAAPGIPGELRLLKRLVAREDPGLDPILKRKYFSDALGLAFYRDNFEVVKWLVEEYLPRGRIRDELDYAAYAGQSSTIRWLWEHHRDRVVWTPMLVYYACGGGHAELAKWLHAEVGVNIPETKERIKEYAIANRQLALLQWAVELGAPICAGDIHKATKFWGMNSMGWVAIVKNVRVGQSLSTPTVPGAHLDVAKWLAMQPGVNLAVSARDMQYASAEQISWALENLQVQNKKSLAKVIDAADSHNDLEFVKLLHENSTGGSCTTAAMDRAASAGHFEMVKWLHENRREGCTKKAMNDAASGGYLEVVKWLHEHLSEGCSTAAMDDAAAHGHLDVVKWLHAHRTEGCTYRAMDRAAGCGNLEMVKWLHRNRREGCTTKAMDRAADCGSLETVQWLHRHRREGCTTRAMNYAARNGHLAVAQWLHANRTEGCTTKAMDGAAMNGHLAVMQWLHANRHEGCTTIAMDGAADIGRLDIVQWLHAHRTEGCTVNVIETATHRGHNQVVQWLVESGRVQVTWDEVMFLIGENQVEAVKWMLPRLPGNFDSRPMDRVDSLAMAKVLHADGRFLLGSMDYRRALELNDWQFFQWLLREYPDAKLSPAEVAEMMERDYDEIRRQEHVRQTYMEDAIVELEHM